MQEFGRGEIVSVTDAKVVSCAQFKRNDGERREADRNWERRSVHRLHVPEFDPRVTAAALHFARCRQTPSDNFDKRLTRFTPNVMRIKLFALLASIVLGGLGGALGAAILGRRDRT